MKRLLPFLVLAVAVPSAFAASNEYLVPIGPSRIVDSHGARWDVSVIGYNFTSHDLDPQCDLHCRPSDAEESFVWSSGLPNPLPIVIRFPTEVARDFAIEEEIVAGPSRAFRLPVIPLDAIKESALTFLGVLPTTTETRTDLRVYSPLGNDETRTIVITIYRDDAPIFRGEYPLYETFSNGVRIAYTGVGWPSEAGPGAGPARIEVTGDGPIWGFVTVSDRSDAPAVSTIFPAIREKVGGRVDHF